LFCAPSRSSFETGFSEATAASAADEESAKRGIKNYDPEKSFSLAHLAALSAKWDITALFYGTTL
jgi:hypothetical protein